MTLVPAGACMANSEAISSRGAWPMVMIPRVRGMAGSYSAGGAQLQLRVFSCFHDRATGVARPQLSLQRHRIRIIPGETDGVAGAAQGAFTGVGFAHEERAAVVGADATEGRATQEVRGLDGARDPG